MGFSFILKELVSATFLQAFAAGAALSATSLGTTFTILSTTQLTTTRLGVVATSAAMIDDVVGLVMVQIISNLGGSAASFSAGTVIRPVFVSLGFAVGLFVVCAFCLRPVSKIGIYHKSKISNFVRTAQFAFLAHTVFLMGIVAGATYAGTSSLFAAYLAGVIVSWFDELVAESKASEIASRPAASYSTSGLFHKHARSHQDATYDAANQTLQTPEPSGTQTSQDNSTSHDETRTGQYIYNKYYKEVTDRILLPLFFVSTPIPPIGETQLTHTGINWIRNPCNGDVPGPNRLARGNLRDPNGNWKNGHSTMARPILHEFSDWSDLNP
jgi:hypothetical protein